MIERYQEEQWAKVDAQRKALSDAREALAVEVAQVPSASLFICTSYCHPILFIHLPGVQCNR